MIRSTAFFIYTVHSGPNEISISGEAVVQRRYTDVCSGCNDVEENQTLSVGGSLPMRVYGVDITIPDVLIVPVDNDGYLTSDFPIEYTIGGDDYNATSAYLFVYKDDVLYDYLILETGPGKEVSLSRGTYFDMESQYKVQIIVNYGTSIEMKGDIVPIYFSSYFIEKVDPEFPDVKLNWDDYYPSLGNKTIVVRGVNKDASGQPIPLTGKVRAEVVYPTPGMDLYSSVSVTPLEANFVDGRIEYTLSASSIAPPINGDVTTGLDKIEIRFNVFDDGNKEIGHIDGKWNVKNNSNTNLKEVLDGKAVFAIDGTFADNHKGKTEGKEDDQREFDFVQKMLNHIIVPLNNDVKKENQTNTITVDGYFGGESEKVIKAIIDGGGPHTIRTGKDITLVQNIKVSHQLNESSSIKTLEKLIKDYSGLTDVNTDRGKVIDQEILVGLNYSEYEKHPVNDSDIGIFELYENDDWDGDGLSNYVEVENAINPLVENPEYTTIGDDKFSIERGGYGNQWKYEPEKHHDTRQGILMNGLRIANVNKGYYYFRSGDPIDDFDNYGALRAINILELVAREWEGNHPDLYPLKRDIFVYNGVTGLDDNDDDDNGKLDNNASTEVRIGFGDISLENGGPFYHLNDDLSFDTGDNSKWDHSTHQNGLSIDIRYPRDDNQEGSFDFTKDPIKLFSKELTQELIGILESNGAINIYIDANTGIAEAGIVKHLSGHQHHLHVDFSIVNVPAGEMTLTVENGITSIPADGNSTARILVDAHDLYRFPLVSVNVRTTHGTIVNGAYDTNNENIGVSDDGTIAFDLKAGTEPVDIVTLTVTSIPSGLQKTIQIEFTTP